MPINNNSDVAEAGGTHWSLLVYHRTNNTYYHLDSWNEHNRHHAHFTANQMEKVLNAPERPNFESIEVPPQHNGYDCGMYVMCFSELLCHQYLSNSKVDLSSVTPEFVAEKRQKIYDQILHLREIM
ncbi:hypothetical protein RvY_10396 [Ramazzottius varieornatus]|uniref:Ubiquitin-like protease family profile domain-containing protein n=1 Tax=Ramazzottius varieornatus TaxID=947166 RepID=A0A1D1VEP6_RAMVA|nr:hypothetical protein RvY_10396 [Ramazzottius varieornatus]